MNIGDKTYEVVTVVNSANEVIAAITDEKVVEKDGHKVILV